MYLYADELKRYSQDRLNSELQTFLKTVVPGEACLVEVMEWVRDNAASFFPVQYSSSQKMDLESNTDESPDSYFCRMWLYMHHIYSKTKRRNILALADELKLTGFCLPGKPGVVCVEGTVKDTREFYSTLRRWNWKSITCRKREVEPVDVDSSRKVKDFREVCFDVHGRQNHMDMGQFLSYLQSHKLQYMFKELFGVEGHSTD